MTESLRLIPIWIKTKRGIFFPISTSSHHNYFQPHIENISNKLTLSLPVEHHLMSKEECFPIDYLVSQDILLEFELFLCFLLCSKPTPNEHFWLARLLFEIVLWKKNQNLQYKLFSRVRVNISIPARLWVLITWSSVLKPTSLEASFQQ